MTAREARPWLAGAALTLALAAAFVGAPRSGAPDPAALARLQDDGPGVVSPVALAEWIRQGRSDLRLLDVRSRSDFETFHLPGAEHAPLDSLPLRSPEAGVMVVVYGERDAAGGARLLLRAAGQANVVGLEGGARAWVDQVLRPVLPFGADTTMRTTFAHVAELSRYFGGTPREAGPDDPAAPAWSWSDSASVSQWAAREQERRGCGW